MDKDGGAFVHHEDPFRTPADKRSPARMWRASLPAPVTIWTSGPLETPAGLTVSSLAIAEGEPSRALGLVNDTTDLFDALTTTQRFVIHILDEDAAELAEIFAGTRPSPGGPFATVDVESSEYGPVIQRFGDRAFCQVTGITDAGYQRLVTATVERFELSGLEPPLVHFRGRMRRLDERGER